MRRPQAIENTVRTLLRPKATRGSDGRHLQRRGLSQGRRSSRHRAVHARADPVRNGKPAEIHQLRGNSDAQGNSSDWPEVASTAPIKRPAEAYEIAGIQALQDYSLAAAVGALDSSLGPLLALSVIAGRTGLEGAESFAKVKAWTHALAGHGQAGVARELLEGTIRGFLAGGDHQAAADAAELLVV